MPELPECKIMSDYINHHSKNKTFNKIFNVEKGNIPSEYSSDNFTLSSSTNGKELQLSLQFEDKSIPVYVFMGMSGNWIYTNTNEWNNTKFVRLRLDDSTGNSLLLHGGYMGPKYNINKHFTGTKRGPDPLKNFDKFKENILSNLDKKDFNKPLGEALLNQKYFNGVGAYLTAEILGRLDISPFKNLKDLDGIELNNLFEMVIKCCNESYFLGGGELRDWFNPFGKSLIDNWIQFYGSKDKCYKQKFGNRNIWIQKKFQTK